MTDEDLIEYGWEFEHSDTDTRHATEKVIRTRKVLSRLVSILHEKGVLDDQDVELLRSAAE